MYISYELYLLIAAAFVGNLLFHTKKGLFYPNVNASIGTTVVM